MGYVVYQRHSRMPLSYDLTPFQILGQKFVKFLGRNLSNFFLGILVQTMTPKGHFEMNWRIKTRNLELHNAIWQEKYFSEFTFEYLLTRRIEDLVLVLSFEPQKSLEKLNFLFDQQMIYLKVEKKIIFQVSYPYKLISQVIFQSFF